jgi:1,2-diacylglycerol 3-beta-galactosyltransferase
MAAKKIDLFYVEAGGGHRSATFALKEVLEREEPDWAVRPVNLNHILSATDWYKQLTGRSLEGWYNLLLKKGWTLGLEHAMKLMHGLIWITHGRQVDLLERHWRLDPPDLVVSLLPHFNRALLQGLRRVHPTSPFVTILTDFADIPPRVWIERQEQHVVCGTDKAVEQAFDFGHPRDRVHRVSGMILRPSFYNVAPVDRAAELHKLGLDPAVPTAMVLFGGEGSGAMVGIARRLRDSGLGLQLILMYGRNESLGRSLAGIGQGRMRVHMQGFTSDVPRFMQLADFMIGKPGPGSITEALAMKLPVIVERNAWTMPQERYNADWVREQGVGLVVGDFRDIVGAVREMLDPARLAEFRRRAAAIRNDAVFEISAILRKLAAS